MLGVVACLGRFLVALVLVMYCYQFPIFIPCSVGTQDPHTYGYGQYLLHYITLHCILASYFSATASIHPSCGIPWAADLPCSARLSCFRFVSSLVPFCYVSLQLLMFIVCSTSQVTARLNHHQHYHTTNNTNATHHHHHAWISGLCGAVPCPCFLVRDWCCQPSCFPAITRSSNMVVTVQHNITHCPHKIALIISTPPSISHIRWYILHSWLVFCCCCLPLHSFDCQP